MKFRQERKHSADFLFPLLLFFLFALLAIEMVLFAAKGYSGILEKRSLNNEAGTCISYVREKIHQNDVAGGVMVADLSGAPALILEKQVGEKRYLTYIYRYNDELRELFTLEGAPVTMDSGTAILKVSDFKVEQAGKRLFFVSCTDTNGTTAEAYVCVRSEITEE